MWSVWSSLVGLAGLAGLVGLAGLAVVWRLGLNGLLGAALQPGCLLLAVQRVVLVPQPVAGLRVAAVQLVHTVEKLVLVGVDVAQLQPVRASQHQDAARRVNQHGVTHRAVLASQLARKVRLGDSLLVAVGRNGQHAQLVVLRLVCNTVVDAKQDGVAHAVNVGSRAGRQLGQRFQLGRAAAAQLVLVEPQLHAEVGHAKPDQAVATQHRPLCRPVLHQRLD